MAHTISVKIRFLPTKRFFAREYPARAEVRQVSSMAATAIQTVLTIQRIAAGTVAPEIATIGFPSSDQYWLKGILISNNGALSLLISFAQLSIVHSYGHQTGVVEFTSFTVLNAPVMIQ